MAFLTPLRRAVLTASATVDVSRLGGAIAARVRQDGTASIRGPERYHSSRWNHGI